MWFRLLRAGADWHQKMKRIVPAFYLQDIEPAFANADLQKLGQ